MTPSTTRKHEQTRPRGPIAWARRRVLPHLARLTALLGVVGLGAWMTGRVLTDEHRWSQYLWWVPPLWALGSAWGMLLLSALLAKLSRRQGGLLLRPLLLLGCLGCTLFLLAGVWRVHRVIGSQKRAPGSVRVLHWNISATKVREGDYSRRLLEQEPDIVLIANARWGKDQWALLEQLAPLAPAEEEFDATYGFRVKGQPGHFNITHRGLIASRYPITRTGIVSTGPLINQENEVRPSGEHGWVIFAQIRLPGEGDGPSRPFTVWFVDLPSDPLAWRMESMRKIKSAIDRWDGRATVPTDRRWVVSETDEPFPAPDLIIGDFNTLRGSASLRIIAPGYRDAFAQAGHGRGRSWSPRISNRWLRQPFKLADWHIDLALTAPGVRATRYQLIHPGLGSHAAQLVDVSRDTGP